MRENGTLPRQTTDAKPAVAIVAAGRIDAAGVEVEVTRVRGGAGRRRPIVAVVGGIAQRPRVHAATANKEQWISEEDGV